MTFQDHLRALVGAVKDADAWYRANADVGAPALFAFRDLLSGIVSNRPPEDLVAKYTALQEHAKPGEIVPQPVFEDLAELLTRFSRSLPPLLARIYLERRNHGNADTGGAVRRPALGPGDGPVGSD